MTNPYAGIYYILDTVLFPTQIIVGKELNRKSHTWLSALSDKMQKQEMKELLEKEKIPLREKPAEQLRLF